MLKAFGSLFQSNPGHESKVILSGKEKLISDRDIRNILFQWWDTRIVDETDELAKGIQFSEPLTQEELLVWDRCFGLWQSLKDSLQAGSLSALVMKPGASRQKIVSIDNQSETLDFLNDMSNYMFGGALTGEFVEPNPEGITFFRNTSIDFDPFYQEPGKSIAARISIDIVAIDANGNLLVEEQTKMRSGDQPYRPDGKPILVPAEIASSFISFTTGINESVPTKMQINEYTSSPHGVVLQIQLHERKKIKTMDIVNDPRVQGMFWQVNQIMQGANPLSSQKLLE